MIERRLYADVGLDGSRSDGGGAERCLVSRRYDMNCDSVAKSDVEIRMEGPCSLAFIVVTRNFYCEKLLKPT